MVEISFEEVGKPIKDMAPRKSPSLDGFTLELFKAYWDIIGIEV